VHLINSQKTQQLEKEKTSLPLLVAYIARSYQYDTMLLGQKQEKNIQEYIFSLLKTKCYNFFYIKQIHRCSGEI